MDFIILLLITCLVLLLCDKNNSPDFLDKLLYNSDFIEKNSKDESPSDSVKPSKKDKGKRKKIKKEEDDLSSNLDMSSDGELVDFDASSEADSLIKEIKGQ